ncbi:MAG: hypothetical protein EZS28_033685 [Streblomastix strix]|uniref:Uncharacterized protein n=1 Tax=Streblomastix strix TaxID=222440 RepID=A0A5J4UJS0_9EUKA|nr:MAG: hypothetical protein EZS28_033685 [Streblomastix strix]
MTQLKPSYTLVQVRINRMNEEKRIAKEVAEKMFKKECLPGEFVGRLKFVTGFGNIPENMTPHLFKVPGESINLQMKMITRCRPGLFEFQHQDIISMIQNLIRRQKEAGDGILMFSI